MAPTKDKLLTMFDDIQEWFVNGSVEQKQLILNCLQDATIKIEREMPYLRDEKEQTK